MTPAPWRTSLAAFEIGCDGWSACDSIAVCKGRVDPSDVLQEAWLDVSARAAEYAARPEMPFFLWMRMITGQQLLEIHRRHLQTKMCDATALIGGQTKPQPEKAPSPPDASTDNDASSARQSEGERGE
jgi:DNA-directed RNA polymerase specialized sigma24 family protein